MQLSNGAIINTTIKFLWPVRPILDNQGQVTGAYFLFNTHKLFFDSVEEAEQIRNEIIKGVPEAETPKDAEELKKEGWQTEPSAKGEEIF